MGTSEMADAPHTAVLSFEYSPARATRIERALRPEVGEIEGDRTRARLTRENGALSITVEANDLVALRAGMNTWSSLIEVAERAAERGQ